MSTITTINTTDLVSASRAVINTNFSNLNTDKTETSVTDAFLGAWTAYTPTLSGGWLATGNASLGCRYVQIGKTIIVYISITNGSSTTYQAGNMTISLPVTTQSFGAIGNVYFEDAGISGYQGIFLPATNSTVILRTIANGTVTNTVPFTWASGDFIQGILMYEAL